MKFIKGLYDWVISWGQTRYALWALFILAFCESSFFPVPADVLLIVICITKPKSAFFYAGICTIGSALGGICGYFIGCGLWHIVQNFFFTYVFSEEIFLKVQALYQKNAFWTVFTAGFTPIPYKIFTIAGGVCEIGLGILIAASILSRGARFFLVAGLLWKFGTPVKSFIDKYFNILTIVFLILLIGGFLILKKVL